MITPFFSIRPERKPGRLGPDDKNRTAEKMSDTLPQTIGIDISKATLDAHAYPAGSNQQFANTASGHKP